MNFEDLGVNVTLYHDFCTVDWIRQCGRSVDVSEPWLDRVRRCGCWGGGGVDEHWVN